MTGLVAQKRLTAAWLLLALVRLPASAADPMVIDGDLNEAAWKAAQVQKFGPSAPGVPAAGGDVRVVVRGRYIYFGVTIPEPEGRFTARSIGRNPHWEEEDMVRIIGGSYPDFEVKVSPLGAYSIETKGVVVENDRFVAAARAGERQWTAEIAIPTHDLKMASLSEIRFTAERIRAARPGTPELRWRWPAVGVSANLPPAEAEGPAPVFRPPWIGNRDPALQAGRVAAVPAETTGWEEGPWRAVQPWRLMRNEPMARAAQFPTGVKALHDGRTLAILARMANADARESFEVFLGTSGSAYVRFSLDSSGNFEDYSGHSGGDRISRPHPEWTSGTRFSVSKENGAWMARFHIPLEAAANALGESKPPKDWRILMVRRRSGETSILPVIQAEMMTAPVRYRALALVDRVTASPDKEQPAAIDIKVLSNQSGMLNQHIRSRTMAILEGERRDWDKVNTRADWERFRDTRIKPFKASLGEFPAKVPLKIEVTREFPGDGYRRQNLVYQSQPGLWVTANLYLPAKPVAKMPGFVIIHSHHRPRTQGELQDMGMLWARAGAAVLIPDQMGAGERLQNHPWNREAYHSRYIMGTQLHLAGESLIKWMVWDTMRGVDLLLERKDVDPGRIILLGAVAGGGDPAAVMAAVDPRITAVVPYNFGESTPESPRFMPEKNRWPLELADPGWGSWETTRNLRGSIAGQYLPWLICASVAPRKFVYAFEMGWNVEDLPAWKRYRKVYSLYDALDNLDESHGFGPFPGPGECTNIGSAQRSSLYPELQRWFGIAPPAKEPEERRPESELQALTPVLAEKLKMREVHDMAMDIAKTRLAKARSAMNALPAAERLEWLRSRWREKLGDIEPMGSPKVASVWKRTVLGVEGEGLALTTEPGITVPMVVLRPATSSKVAVIVSQGGKDRILAHRRAEIEALLKAGIAVCLPDVRGTGETAPDGRRSPQSMGLSGTEQMLGGTLAGAQLKDLRTVIQYLAARSDSSQLAVWGDSHVPVNPSRLLLDELPNWQMGPQIQNQAEPLGGLLAALSALYESKVQAVAIHRGLVSYLSVLNDRFAYVPADAMIPGILEVGDLDDIYASLVPRPVLLSELVDGRNRMVGKTGTPSAWLIEQLSRR